MNRNLENAIARTFLNLGIALASKKSEKPIVFFAEALVRLLWPILGREKKIVYTNLEIAFGDKIDNRRRQEIAYNTIRNLALTAAELLRCFKLEAASIVNMAAEVDGWEYIENAQSKGRGIIGLGLHFGNWEYAAYYLSLRGIKTTTFALPLHDPVSDDYINQIRNKFGVRVIRANTPFLSDIKATFESNNFVGLIADQYAGSKGMLIPFMGKPAYTYTGPAVFHLKFQADILPIYTIRLAPFRFKVVIEKPIEYPDLTESRDVNLKLILTAISERIATIVAEYPDCWMWTHKRWKTP